MHHLNSRIPYYRLPRVLRDHPELRNVGRLTLLESFRCVRLVLWDETQRRLVSFREARYGGLNASRYELSMHIGLIGGIGPAATDFYYRGLIERHAAAGIPLELTIAHADVREMSRNLNKRTPARQAEIFARLVGRMKAAGAEAAAVTSMGGHFCVKELCRSRRCRWSTAIPEVDAAITRGGSRRSASWARAP